MSMKPQRDLSHVRPSLQVVRSINKRTTRLHVVYTALFASLLLNLLIFVTVHVGNFYSNTKVNMNQASNIVKPKGAYRIDNVAFEMPNVDRQFKSLDERLKKYDFQQNKKLNHSENAQQKSHGSTTKTFNRDFIGKKSSSNLKSRLEIDRREAQRLADERNHRSEYYLKQIMNNKNKTNGSKNEHNRSKYLMVLENSKNLHIWLHRTLKMTENYEKYYEYEDGIMEQLNFVSESYKKQLKILNLADNFMQNLTKGKYVKLSNYLKKEFSTVLDNSPQNDVQFRAEVDRSPSNNKNKSNNNNNKRLEGANSFEDRESRAARGPDWSTLLKVIYVPDGLNDDVGYGRKVFLECPVSACYLTSQPAFKETAHLRVEQMYALEKHKPPGQIWLNWFLESPVNSVYLPQGTFDDRINWTASFRADSTIVTPYAKYLPHSPPRPTRSSRNYAKGKSRMVAWFVSSCGSTNNRLTFVKRLRRHVQVDVYGACGFLECDIKNKSLCFQLLSSHYKFYLSFENSNCDYYITEKLFVNALQNNVVPVVMGARKMDYIKAAPPNSFIHVEDFKNERELAKYLKKLDNNDTEYNKYFAWKGKGDFLNTKFWCRLCGLLQDDHKPHLWYSNFEEWWMSEGTCRSGRW